MREGNKPNKLSFKNKKTLKNLKGKKPK